MHGDFSSGILRFFFFCFQNQFLGEILTPLQRKTRLLWGQIHLKLVLGGILGGSKGG